MYKLACLSLLGLSLVAQPAMAQNRFMDEAREKAARRAENAAIREAEHPETVNTAASQKTAQAQQSAQTMPAQTQPATAEQSAAPATPAAAQ